MIRLINLNWILSFRIVLMNKKKDHPLDKAFPKVPPTLTLLFAEGANIKCTLYIDVIK